MGMAIRLGAGFFYTLASVPLMIAGVVAPDVFHLTIRVKEIVFFGCMASAFVSVIVGAAKEIQQEGGDSSTSGHRLRMIAIYGMLICGLGFFAFAAAYFWPLSESVPVDTPHSEVIPVPPSLFDVQLKELKDVEEFIGNKSEKEWTTHSISLT